MRQRRNARALGARNRILARHPTVVIGAAVLIVMAIIAVAAPLIAGDPLKLTPIKRLKPPDEPFWFGTDFLGRDVYARTTTVAKSH